MQTFVNRLPVCILVCLQLFAGSTYAVQDNAEAVAPQPVTEPAPNPVMEPAPKPVTEPATEPTPKPVTEPVVAPAIEPIPPPIPQTPRTDVFDPLQSSRNYLSSRFTRFASFIDDYFGGNRHYQESNPSTLNMVLTRPMGYGGTDQLDLAARVDLKLPISEGRLRLLVETDPEHSLEDEVAKSTNAVTKKSTQPKSVGVAGRYALATENNWSFRVDGGVKLPLPPRPFVRTKVGYTIPIEKWRMTAAQSVYWYSDTGVGETSQMDWERSFDSPLLFRASSAATWFKDTQNFDLSQSFSFYQSLDDRTALLYQINMFGVTQPSPQMNDLAILFLCRYRLHQKWMYFEFSPQLHFPKEMNYKYSPALTMRLEVLFDDKR